jgi:hypothetical protein
MPLHVWANATYVVGDFPNTHRCRRSGRTTRRQISVPAPLPAGMESSSIHALDYPDQLVSSVAVLAGETDEFPGLRDDGTMVGGRRDRDAAPPAKLEEPFVAQLPERAQDGVAIDLKDGSQVTRRRQPLAGAGLSLGDRAPDLGCNLLMEIDRLLAVDLDLEHGASNSSFTNGQPLEHPHPPTTWPGPP